MLKKIGQVIVTAFNTLYSIASVLARVLLVAMVLIISVNIFMRYVLGSGLRWGEEIALVLVGWFVFLSIPMGVRMRLHISLHLWRRPTPVLDAVLTRIAAAGVIVVGVVFMIYGNRLIAVAMRSIMPASRLPSGVLYMVLPLAAILMIYEGATDLVGYETDPERRKLPESEEREEDDA
jgi:TRAP-type C4-dicarboxylate transport system permease small subunit